MQRLGFDRGWRSRLGEIPDGVWREHLDDSDWRPVDLPHDWSIELPRDPASAGGSANGYFPAGVGWYLVARFLGLVLAGEPEMDPDDYRLEGTVGQVTVSIPSGGTGEVVFAKAGAWRSEAARASGGQPIPRGSEVVITTYMDGFATVQPWGEFLAARDKLAVAENREA